MTDLSGVLANLTGIVEGLIPWDTIRITRPAPGQQVLNKTTGLYEYPDAELVYEGRGAVQLAGTAAQVVSVPSANLPWTPETRSKYQLYTPIDAPVPEKDMIVSVVAVHTGGDLALLGRQWRVQDPGGAATMSVIRVTALDQVQQTRQGS
jgi:hypothetical protein